MKTSNVLLLVSAIYLSPHMNGLFGSTFAFLAAVYSIVCSVKGE